MTAGRFWSMDGYYAPAGGHYAGGGSGCPVAANWWNILAGANLVISEVQEGQKVRRIASGTASS
jgi:hypothetical protein